MALQIWLPLNGNLRNQGLTDIEVTNNGATIDNNGKIGKCYSFNNSNSGILLNGNFLDNLFKTGKNPFSICMWVYHADTTRAILFGNYHNNNNLFNIELGTNHSIRFDWCANPDYSVSNISASNWTHIAVTYNGNIVSIYKDGILIDSRTVSLSGITSGFQWYIGRDARTGNTVLNGKLNDFRIYDHALSVKEVKEIAKGLVLHYPLNCNGIGIPNLVDNSATFSGWTAQSGWTLGEIDGIKTYSFNRTGATSNNWVRLIPTLQVNGNDYPNGITVSMDIYTPDKSAINQRCFGSLQTYQASGSRIGFVEPQWDVSKIINNQWCRISQTFTQAQLLNNNTSGTTYAYTKFSFQLVQNGNISIRKIKIEEGNKAATYTISINDLNDNREFDTSGYQRDGTLVSTFPAIDSDTPRYCCAYKYSGSTRNIHYNTTTDLNFTDNFSWSLWIKTNYTGNTAQYAFTVGRADAGGYGYGLHIASTSNCNIRFGNASYGVSVMGGQWTHLVFTKSGTTIKIYKNGELYSTNTFNGTLPTYSDGNGVGIGCFHYASGNIYPYYGSLSDFRIYATALSAADVKALYTDAGYVDKNGNFHAYEFVEG